MKKFLAIIVLGLFLIAPSQADDIRDFQIEGMSVGDSLLDHFSLKQVKNGQKNTYKNDKFVGVELRLSDYEKYKFAQIHYDSNYIIASVVGAIIYEDIEECYIQQNEIENEFKLLFGNVKMNKGKIKHNQDPSGKSFFTSVEFSLKTGDALIHCTDWSKEFESNGFVDNLRVEISTKEFSDFLRNEAY